MAITGFEGFLDLRGKIFSLVDARGSHIPTCQVFFYTFSSIKGAVVLYCYRPVNKIDVVVTSELVLILA
jgi:hypothetical protein